MPESTDPRAPAPKTVFVCLERRKGAACSGAHDKPGTCECGSTLVAATERRVRD